MSHDPSTSSSASALPLEALKRRHLLARIGLLGLGAYAAPALINLNSARADDRFSRESRPSRISRLSRRSGTGDRYAHDRYLGRQTRSAYPQRQARASRWSRPSRG